MERSPTGHFGRRAIIISNAGGTVNPAGGDVLDQQPSYLIVNFFPLPLIFRKAEKGTNLYWISYYWLYMPFMFSHPCLFVLTNY